MPRSLRLGIPGTTRKITVEGTEAAACAAVPLAARSSRVSGAPLVSGIVAVNRREPHRVARPPRTISPSQPIPARIATSQKEMRAAAKRLDFERATQLRDQIRDFEKRRQGIVDAELPARESSRQPSAVSLASGNSAFEPSFTGTSDDPVLRRPHG